MGISVSDCTRLVRTARWLSITPLARPVVPLEYGSSASAAGSMGPAGGFAPCVSRSPKPRVPRSSSRVTITGQRLSAPRAASAAAARAVGRNAVSVSRNLAPESPSWAATSPGVHIGFSPVTTPPAAIAPKHATSHSGEFGARIANVSPGRSPCAASPTAIRHTALANSP